MFYAAWQCTYHIVWASKYRHRILKGEIKDEVASCIRTFSSPKRLCLT
ncbi:MAG: hypothetical protein GXO81_02900 [Chlorobi bacterium]|nr:hypothetical protein [Chlorobiota bacterium]